VKLKALRPFYVLLAILAGLAAIYTVDRWVQPKERVPWMVDYPQALAEAQRQHKPLFLYFTASWCGPCQQMRHSTWANADVAKALGAYVPVELDIDQPSSRPLIQRYLELPASAGMTTGPLAVPDFVIVGLDGHIQRASVGAMDAPTFLNWIAR
jgi:thiol:disulfide interchange protein